MRPMTSSISAAIPLRAFQVISRIRARFDVNLSIATVFAKSTVAELADEIARALGDTDGG